MEIKQWWPRMSFEARLHLKARLHEPLDMTSRDALLAAGALQPGDTNLALGDDDWTWIEQYG